jgi:hypothetical protein
MDKQMIGACRHCRARLRGPPLRLLDPVSFARSRGGAITALTAYGSMSRVPQGVAAAARP